MSYSPNFVGNSSKATQTQLVGTTSGGIVTETAAPTTATYAFVWPSNQAAAPGYVLTNDGSGNLSWAPTALAGADTNLNNLSATAVNVDINPGITQTINLGNSSLQYNSIWASTVKATGGLGFDTNGSGYLTGTQNLNSIQSSLPSTNALLMLSQTLPAAVASDEGLDAYILSSDNSSGASGNIQLLIGTASGSRGKIKFRDGTEGTIGYVWTSTATDGSGSWMPVSAGSVTSVALTDSTGLFNVSGSPITSSGTLNLASLQSQAANSFFAGPDGSSGAPSFRAIVPADVPTLNQNTTGTAFDITTTSNSTLTTLSALSLPGSQVTGNIAGDAANITATSNSTLTTLSALSLPGSQVTGNISGNAANITATTNSTLTTLSALSLPTSQLSGQVTLAQLPTIATDTILGNNTGGSATPTALTVAQVNAILPVFTSSLNGLVPASGGGTTNFLRADGNWAVAGTGSVTSVSVATANGFAGTVANPTTTPAITISTTVTGILYGNGTSVAAAVAGNFPTLNQSTTGTAANITASSNTSLTSLANLATVGTITSGTWNGTIIAIPYGGTGSATTSQGYAFIGPVSGSGAPSFRALVASDIPSLSATYVTQSEVGAASGVASLDGSGRIPSSQLPSTVLQYEGLWNPTTNTPNLQDSTGTNGYVYQVSANYNSTISGLNNSTMTNFLIGNLIIYSSTLGQWEQTTPAAGVSSVNGSQGSVTVNAINQLSGDVTTAMASGSQSEVATISAGAVTLAKMASLAANSIIGNNTGSSATPLALTATQVTAMLNTFTSSLQGLAPASGGGTVNFLRADGTWAPAGTGTVTSVALADGSTTPIYTISGSPVTSSGTLTFTLASQSANTFFAAPNGSSGQPGFRAIVSADIPTLNQNTTGTAANITATSNSTLTTLSALSLPGSQVTGNISGNAANITATTNSTLTTLSALSLPASQLTGTIAAARMPALTGDVTTSAGSVATSLVATSNGTLTTLTGLTTAAALATVGTITSGTWNASLISPTYGGTGVANPTAHGVLVGEGTSAVTSIVGGAGTLFQGNGSSADPTWTVTPTLGVNGTSNGTLALATITASGQSVTIQNLSTTSAWNFNLPTGAGSVGQVLTSGGGGSANMTWATALTGAVFRAGSTSCSNGATSQAVTFSSALGSTAYGVVATFVNTTDTNPQFQPVTITATSTTGFTAKWDGALDTSNYVLNWLVFLNN